MRWPQGLFNRDGCRNPEATMVRNPFVGTWTYRSFYNIPDPVDSFDKIRLFQAELFLEADGADLVRGRLSFGDDHLDVHGTVRNGERPSIRMRATGIDGTATAGWIYDYVGFLAPHWPDGNRQRSAIVGTVIRTAFHQPNRVAGDSASFVAVSRDVPPVTVYELPESVIEHFADRLHRLHHTVWHGLRNTWEILRPTQRQAIATLGWEPPRLARQWLIAQGRPVFKRPYIGNGSGEDFLYFHRQMLQMYRTLMKQTGAEPIVWAEIPPPAGGEISDAIPGAWEVPEAQDFERRIAALKSDAFFWGRMRWWDQQFKDPVYLATLTLGELGALIEFSVHNDMHMRWSEQPRDPVTNAPLTAGRPLGDIATKWDNPRNNYLGDFYSSHVNPIFWRLHGWIDDRIEDWFDAHKNKHPNEVMRQQVGGVEWFETGHWVQVPQPWVWGQSGTSSHGHDSSGDRDTTIRTLEEIVHILYPPKTERAELAQDRRKAAELAEQLQNMRFTFQVNF